MTITTDIRPKGHGHTVRINGADIDFDTVWDGYGEDLQAVVVWTHDLSDAEVLLRVRAYLEGPFASAFADPYADFGIDLDDAWPDVSDDLVGRVRRSWGRWRPLTAEEKRDSGSEDGAVRWVESELPAEGFSPACVVDLAGG